MTPRLTTTRDVSRVSVKRRAVFSPPHSDFLAVLRRRTPRRFSAPSLIVAPPLARVAGGCFDVQIPPKTTQCAASSTSEDVGVLGNAFQHVSTIAISANRVNPPPGKASHEPPQSNSGSVW
mmetsp:Transcript_11940/g.46322  ORF Transcript_11940/g.46322 Transcript_11940/m.46322 type:complete len:121 (+) Transcript_11940:1146-1508(+)